VSEFAYKDDPGTEGTAVCQSNQGSDQKYIIYQWELGRKFISRARDSPWLAARVCLGKRFFEEERRPLNGRRIQIFSDLRMSHGLLKRVKASTIYCNPCWRNERKSKTITKDLPGHGQLRKGRAMIIKFMLSSYDHDLTAHVVAWASSIMHHDGQWSTGVNRSLLYVFC
jgi:hypothetical protein